MLAGTPVRSARSGSAIAELVEERANLDRQAATAADAAPRKGDAGTYNDFWFGRGKRTNRTSLITDSPDGRLPPLTPKGQELQNTIGKARRGAPTGQKTCACSSGA